MRDNLSARSLTSMLSFHTLLKHLHTFGSKYSMKAQEFLFVCTPIIAAKAFTSPWFIQKYFIKAVLIFPLFQAKERHRSIAKSLHMLGKGMEAVADQWGVSGGVSRLTAPVLPDHRCHHICPIGKPDSTGSALNHRYVLNQSAVHGRNSSL